MAKFSWINFLGELPQLAAITTGVVVAIKDNPAVSDFQKATAALIGASTEAQLIDPADTQTIQGVTNVVQTVLGEIGQALGK